MNLLGEGGAGSGNEAQLDGWVGFFEFGGEGGFGSGKIGGGRDGNGGGKGRLWGGNWH